ncbi:hypothetical protein PHISCL_05316 [Aspergillus sclerotialis]|uniref:Uncharacterized protein n=1 Tax=Aspergillus sclerotialis TaxID=2070753 RepID=A0A3A2ZGM3_9EURO|nr:hypothetical protein PHISCL_05316 [Aspergillus sclerotialis]
MELDDEADGLLRQALGRVRGTRQRRPPAAMSMSPEMEISETPVPPVSRGRGRHGRSHSRQ